MLFQKNIVKKYVSALSEETIAQAWSQYKSYFLNADIQTNIRQSKEEQFQEGFLRELFVKVLGYTLNPSPNYNLITEQKNETNSKKADGAILVDEKVVGVIELKDHKTTDLSKIEQQAFGYKNQNKNAVYVVISNFEKLRFYIENAVECIEFDLFHLTEDEFRMLWLCLAYENIAANLPKRIKTESVSSEDAITNALYRDYSTFKQVLFDDICKNNCGDASNVSTVELYKKTQKLLDRLLFIFFAEDSGLLQPNTMVKIIADWEKLSELDAYVPLYDRIKKYFGYLDTGYKGKDIEIFAYNGGLFKPDEVLDNLTISDDVLATHTRRLADYDYKSEVDVNILGHIFENSLNEIENVAMQSASTDVARNVSTTTKRKRDGVFYTPQYITKYIVENTVGRLCTEKKAELGIDESEYFSDRNRRHDTKKALIDKLNAYREWLLGISICDPACGSGAFLNAALQFLIGEHHLIDEMDAKITGSDFVFPNIENSILENNLFGVDINEESVEIAKLALWLRTAKPNRKLNSLNKNIKCGNSLISDPEVAGDKAFDWAKEFPQIFAKGGFDVVIGNPPYGIYIDNSLKDYYTTHFPLAKYKLNLYILFIERLFQIFKKGIVSLIIPKSLLVNSYFEDIRRYLLKNSRLVELFTITEKVFEDAEVGSSLIITFELTKEVSLTNLVRMANCERTDSFASQSDIIETHLSQQQLLENEKTEIVIQTQGENDIKQKIQKLSRIRLHYNLKNGLNPGNIKDKLITRNIQEKTKKIIWGKEIKKYNIIWSGDYIIYDEHIADGLTLDDLQSKKGMNKQTKIDFALRDESLFEIEKLVVRKTGDRLIASYDDKNYYFDTLVHGIYQKESNYDLKFLLAILNSKPATYFYRMLHDIKGKVFAKISLDDLSEFPLPETSTEQQQPFIEKADQMLTLTAELQQKVTKFLHRITETYNLPKVTAALETFYTLEFKAFIKELEKQKIKLSLLQKDELEEYFNAYKAECVALKTQIATTDAAIDNMVYQLYGLTEEEIKVVEGE